MKWFSLFILTLSAPVFCAAESPSLTLFVGGLKPGAVLKVSDEITLREPGGPRGEYKHGFRVLNDSAAEWQKFYGVRFEVKLPDSGEVELTATIQRYRANANAAQTPVSGTVRINGKGVVGDAIRRPNFLYRLILGLLPF